jgi:hypothetical protein
MYRPSASSDSAPMSEPSYVLDNRYATRRPTPEQTVESAKVPGQQGLPAGSPDQRCKRIPIGMRSALTMPKRLLVSRLRWSALVWSPPPESNRRPHPYHGSAAKRRANRRLRSSRRTVGGEGMCSVADRLGGAGWSDCQHYPSVGLRATRSTACTWAAKRWRSGGSKPASWSQPRQAAQRVDPAAGSSQ